MYGESSFTWEYVCGYATREQRKRRLARRAYTLGAAVCIVSLTVMLSAKLVAAGGVRYLKEKLWNAEEAAELPMDGKVTEAVQAQEMALPVAVALAQAAATGCRQRRIFRRFILTRDMAARTRAAPEQACGKRI